MKKSNAGEDGMTESTENTAEVNDLNAEASIKETSEKKGEEKAPVEDFKSKYFYLAAEMDNMRKRFERDRESLLKFGNEKVLGSLIDVLDNLDLAAGALGNDSDPKIKNLLVGVDMVRKQFLDVLTGNGLTPVESLGKAFDPNFHEAMGQQKAEGKAENEVIFEYKKGYVLNGRLLRPAKVIVAKND